MTLPGKIVTGLVVAALASITTTLLTGGQLTSPTLHIAFAIATLATVFLTSLSTAPGSSDGQAGRHDQDADREEGEVKWFNVSKGFGFITKDDGEEIFVHFRSIRGEGRRSLKDGQRVSFHVADSDKGPQAEDVIGY